jgi:hypothetical protein
MREENYKLLKYKRADEEPKLSNHKSYYGVYKGVQFEIKNFWTEYSGNSWCHYIRINLDKQLTKEQADKFWLEPKKRETLSGHRISYDYYDSIINGIEFHGGCTWYSKESSPDEPDNRVVKIGCDYQHLWDEGNSYGLNYVYDEVKQSIDSFLLIVGKIRYPTWGDGIYRYEEEFEIEPSTPSETHGDAE